MAWHQIDDVVNRVYSFLESVEDVVRCDLACRAWASADLFCSAWLNTPCLDEAQRRAPTGLLIS